MDIFGRHVAVEYITAAMSFLIGALVSCLLTLHYTGYLYSESSEVAGTQSSVSKLVARKPWSMSWMDHVSHDRGYLVLGSTTYIVPTTGEVNRVQAQCLVEYQTDMECGQIFGRLKEVLEGAGKLQQAVDNPRLDPNYRDRHKQEIRALVRKAEEMEQDFRKKYPKVFATSEVVSQSG